MADNYKIFSVFIHNPPICDGFFVFNKYLNKSPK